MPPATAPTAMSPRPTADTPVLVAVEVVPSPVCAPPLGMAVTRTLAVAELPSLQSMAGLNVPGLILPGSVTVMLKTPPLDTLSMGICCGRPSVTPNSVADVACTLPQVTWNVTDVPGVTVDGEAKATADPGVLAVAASAGPDTAAAAMPRPSTADP